MTVAKTGRRTEMRSEPLHDLISNETRTLNESAYRVLTCWPSDRRPFGSAATMSPLATPDVISTFVADLLAERDDPLLDPLSLTA